MVGRRTRVRVVPHDCMLVFTCDSGDKVCCHNNAPGVMRMEPGKIWRSHYRRQRNLKQW